MVSLWQHGQSRATRIVMMHGQSTVFRRDPRHLTSDSRRRTSGHAQAHARANAAKPRVSKAGSSVLTYGVSEALTQARTGAQGPKKEACNLMNSSHALRQLAACACMWLRAGVRAEGRRAEGR